MRHPWLNQARHTGSGINSPARMAEDSPNVLGHVRLKLPQPSGLRPRFHASADGSFLVYWHALLLYLTLRKHCCALACVETFLVVKLKGRFC